LLYVQSILFLLHPCLPQTCMQFTFSTLEELTHVLYALDSIGFTIKVYPDQKGQASTIARPNSVFLCLLQGNVWQ